MAANPFFRWLLCCLLLIAAGSSAHAQLTECALPQAGLSLTSTLSSLADPDATLNLEQARARYAVGAFKAHSGGRPSYGYVQGALWAHLQLPAVAQDCQALFVLEQPRIQSVELFVLQADGAVQSLRMGVDLPFAARAVAHRFPNLRIARAAGPAVDVFFRVRSDGSVQLPFGRYTEAAPLTGSPH